LLKEQRGDVGNDEDVDISKDTETEDDDADDKMMDLLMDKK